MRFRCDLSALTHYCPSHSPAACACFSGCRWCRPNGIPCRIIGAHEILEKYERERGR